MSLFGLHERLHEEFAANLTVALKATLKVRDGFDSSLVQGLAAQLASQFMAYIPTAFEVSISPENHLQVRYSPLVVVDLGKCGHGGLNGT